VIATSNQKSTAADPSSKLGNEQTFLQLLVAQIKNQNPLNPTDSMQFVTQLAQFSQLEQMLAVRKDTDAIAQQIQSATPTDQAPATQNQS
jgi:flagellar basal-body rod modification protein FlgD